MYTIYACTEDAQEVCALYRRCALRYGLEHDELDEDIILNWINDPSRLNVLVRDNSGKLIGVATAHCEESPHGDDYNHVWVDGFFSIEGAGKELLREVEEYARLNGCSRIYVSTEYAGNYFIRCGFYETSSIFMKEINGEG